MLRLLQRSRRRSAGCERLGPASGGPLSRSALAGPCPLRGVALCRLWSIGLRSTLIGWRSWSG
eukprot:11458764-Alexandrium_andersonii.AAC.1